MKFRPIVQVVASVVVGVFAIGIWFTGGQVDLGWLRFFSGAVLVATVVLNLWDRWLWALPLSQRAASVPRDIRGTWQGTLTSFWTDPKTGKTPEPKLAYLVVRQTSSSVSVILTDESKSVSSLGIVTTDPGQVSLDYIFLNRPESRVEHRSRMHHGSASLDVSGRPATKLRGRYWTDRDTRGELDFTERRSALKDDYRDAAHLFGQT